MSLDLILILVIFISLVGIFLIVVRKFPLLSRIDVSRMPQVKQSRLKDKIMEERIKRRFFKTWQSVSQKSSGLWVKIKEIFNKLYTLILNLEKKYKARLLRMEASQSSPEKELKVINLLREGEELINEEKLSEAEQKYIEVLSLDPKNIQAYQSLGEIYFLIKEYSLAKETLKHLLKLNSNIPQAYFDLAQIYQIEGKLSKALTFGEKALKLEPLNPRFLDFLIELCIELKIKDKASDFLNKLREINPENEKLEELEKRITKLD